MIDVKVLDVRPHPDQTTTHPNYWAVRLRVEYEGSPRIFWRWHSARKDHRPTPEEILERFWRDTFIELHGFDFERIA